MIWVGLDPCLFFASENVSNSQGNRFHIPHARPNPNVLRKRFALDFWPGHRERKRLWSGRWCGAVMNCASTFSKIQAWSADQERHEKETERGGGRSEWWNGRVWKGRCYFEWIGSWKRKWLNGGVTLRLAKVRSVWLLTDIILLAVWRFFGF